MQCEQPTNVYPVLLTMAPAAERLDDIPYVDYPEIQINKNESTQMPFRYVKNDKGMPVMPEVCVLRLVTPLDD